MKVCPNCKATCADDDVFCGGCGFQFSENSKSEEGNDYYNAGKGFVEDSGRPPRNNPFAVASLVLGIASFVLLCCYYSGVITAILSIIFACVGRKSIRNSNGAETGMGLSTAGLVLGIIALALAIVGIIVALVASAWVSSVLGPTFYSNLYDSGIAG